MDEEEKIAEKVKEPENNDIQEPVEKEPMQAELGKVEPTKKEMLHKLMSEKFEGYKPDDEEGNSSLLMEYINHNEDQSSKMANALAKDPRLAQALADIVSGKRGSAGALARYFGKDFLSAEEGSPEAEEIAKAEEERKKELDDMDSSKKEYQDNVDASMPAILEYCKEKGCDPDEFLGKVWDEIVNPIFMGTYSKDLLDKLDKAFNYDKDVNDAMAAGEVKGRNTKINKMKEDVGDGLPKNIVDLNKPSNNVKRPKTILDLAQEA